MHHSTTRQGSARSVLGLMRLVLLIALLAVALTPGVGIASQAEGEQGIPGRRTIVIVGTQGRSLAASLQTATGKPVPIIPAAQYKPAEDQYPIHVGDDPATLALVAPAGDGLDVEGYVIDITPQRAVLAARPAATDTGSPLAWAQYAFASRFLGIHHYFPGPLGVVTPDKPITPNLPAGRWVVNPDYLGRHWSGYAGSASPGWGVRASGGGGRYLFHHRLWEVFPAATYGQSHPEFYPVIIPDLPGQKPSNHPTYRHLKPGERYIPPAGRTINWQPCTSNPQVIKLTVEYVLAQLAKRPGNPTVSLGINDNNGYCQCPDCLKITPPGVDPLSRQAQGHRFYVFYNQVAQEVQKTRPDAKIGFLVYAALNSWTPERLNPLLMPYLTMSMADMWDPAYKDNLMRRFDDWAAIANQFGIYEYLQGDGFAIPRLYLHHQAQGLKRVHELGASGFYAEAYPNWGLDGPKLWVVRELLWDSSQDVDALLDQWCNDLFRAAGPAMRRYFDRLEQAWNQQKPADDRRGGYRLLNTLEPQFAQVFPPEVCDAAWALLLEARAAAGDDALALARIEYFQAAFGMTRTASARYAAAQQARGISLQEVLKDDAQATKLVLAYHSWLTAGSIDQAIDTLLAKAPNGLQVQCVPGVTPESLRRTLHKWDTDFPARVTLAHALIQKAASGLPQGEITLAGLHDAIDQTLAHWQASEQVRQDLAPLARRMIVVARKLDAPPELDGDIEAAWGQPAFQGRFFTYPSLFDEHPAGNKIWLRYDDQHIYVAGVLEQEGFKPNPGALGHDQVTLRQGQPAQGTLDLSQYRETFQYLYSNAGKELPNVSSIGICLPLYTLVMMTPEGGLLDATGTPYGYSPAWNGVRFAVKLLPGQKGWSFEAIIPRSPDAQYPWPAGHLQHGVNFFRPVDGKLTAWTPGVPSRWAITPISAGFILYE